MATFGKQIAILTSLLDGRAKTPIFAAKRLLLQIGFMQFIALIVLGANNTVTSTITNVDGATQLEFQGLSQWPYELNRANNDHIVITVPELDVVSMQQLRQWSDNFVKNIAVSTEADSKTKLTITLADKTVETFDYLTDNPSRLIIDFFRLDNKEKTASIKNASQSKIAANQKPKTQKSAETIGSEQNQLAANAATNSTKDQKGTTAEKVTAIDKREPATADTLVIDPKSLKDLTSLNQENKLYGISDGADLDLARFDLKSHEISEDAIIASRENIYLAYPPLKLNNRLLEELALSKPIYEIEPENDQQNKEARFLLLLFNKERFATFEKVLDYFKKKYGKTKYDELLQFMLADGCYTQWEKLNDINFFERAIIEYERALVLNPDSVLADRTKRLIGLLYFERRNYLKAIQIFQRYLADNPQSEQAPIIRLKLSEAMLEMSLFKEALNELTKVEQLPENGIEASYRKGDIFLKQKRYAEATAAYKDAIGRYPQAWQPYPNSFFNMAEAQFWAKNFKDSLDTYRTFLQRYPAHDFAAYAMTRVGELLEILGADSKKVMSAYRETHFRYGNQPGATVAKIRILGRRIAEMKEKQVEHAVKEVIELAKQTPLDNIDRFVTLTIADGYSQREQYDKAIDYLEKFYREHSTEQNLEVFTNRIVRNINEKIRDAVFKGDFVNALDVYEKYSDSWLHKSTRIDTKFYVGKAFELAGVYDEASELYRTALNKIYAIRNTEEEKRRAVLEKLPCPCLLNLRIANVLYEKKEYQKALDALKEIKDVMIFSDIELIEYTELAANLAQKRGDYAAAKSYLEQLLTIWQGRPGLEASVMLRLAEMQYRENSLPVAQEQLEKIIKLSSYANITAEIQIKALKLLAEIYIEQQDNDHALQTLADLLTIANNTNNQSLISQTRYRMGELYLTRGDLQKANETWLALEPNKDGVWYKLAKERIEHNKFQNDYKKYLKRIPAMAELKKE